MNKKNLPNQESWSMFASMGGRKVGMVDEFMFRLHSAYSAMMSGIAMAE